MDINADEFETPLEDDAAMAYFDKYGFFVLWMGDDREPHLTEYYEIPPESVGWYWVIHPLSPRGPFETSTVAFNDAKQYISEK